MWSPPALMATRIMGTEDKNTPRTGISPQENTTTERSAVEPVPITASPIVVKTVLIREMKICALKFSPTTWAKRTTLEAMAS